MTRDQYMEARVEVYRARGEDYRDSYLWASQDCDAAYGKKN